ncbi:MAG: aminoacyl-tRNA hydrolase [Acutalibacteraceae bacterium]|nr:aminoacyl-tRNA hydrolase [Acutalibacteraceae bacterium]
MFKNLRKSFSNTGFDMMIVGLGNPGLEYEKTRHNVGFMAMDALCEKYECDCKKVKFSAYMGDAVIGKKRVLLLKPQTYMNNSGAAVSEAARFYKIAPENILVMYDDISLAPGLIRIRRKGSAGGHNGIKDIIALLGSEDFPRIKIGVGAKPHPEYDLKDWVLGKFSPEDKEKVDTALENTVKAVNEILARGIDSAMNKYSK